MQYSLLLTSLVMGLVGGSHCVAMCGVACAAITRHANRRAYWQFYLGRILGYALLGALAAIFVGFLATLSRQTAVLHPLWTFFHVLILCWGLLLLLYGRQPIWVERLGHRLWESIQTHFVAKQRLAWVGMGWALLPCGLLYSAVLVASMSGSAYMGALSMVAFALGSNLFLILAPWLWTQLANKQKLKLELYGMRLAGLLLFAVAASALWMDVVHQTQLFCLVP